ncbi:PAS domain S-box protein [Marinomonas agarivorans]|nr:PAS domain S-box protein [Marinomonas agarivorans]
MLLIDPIANQILSMNVRAQQLFQLDHVFLPESVTEPKNTEVDKNAEQLTSPMNKPLVSTFFHECLGELIHFTQQVMEQGIAWSSDLIIKIHEELIPLDIEATQLGDTLLFSCHKSSDNFARYQAAIAQSNYRSGLAHWRQHEAVFEEIEKQNQLLLKAVGDGIYGVDTQGRTTFVNKAAELIIGWRREDLIGQKIHDIMHHTHLDGRPYPTHDCPIYAAFNDGIIHSVDDEVFWSKDGQAIPVEYTSTPVTENGVLVGAVVIFRDITERKRIQKALLDALEEVDHLKQRLEMENAYLIEELNADFNHHQIIGQSIQVQQMVQQINLVGPTDANVLIIGESGTGKELIARAIHEVSNRKARPLIRVNCAAIPADLFESEFFGHVKGAFSGAVTDRIGRFELADGATLFLDEVGEIPFPLQGKLLRVLQEQQFERVGESRTRHVDVRVIAATNQDLKQLVQKNAFREDLYFRLNVFPIQSPALRDRVDDIPLLVSHFIDKVCVRINQPYPKITRAHMQILMQYHWPGNIRELENIIERQIILAQGQRISFDFLVQNLGEIQPATQLTTPTLMSAQQHKALEKRNLEQALQTSGGKIYGINGAAELLGLKPTTLTSKLKKYDIDRRAFLDS